MFLIMSFNFFCITIEEAGHMIFLYYEQCCCMYTYMHVCISLFSNTSDIMCNSTIQYNKQVDVRNITIEAYFLNVVLFYKQ